MDANTVRTAETKALPPSFFADRGSPSCSMWGKAEIEWMARDYVTALANGGDTWRPLTREQVVELCPKMIYKPFWIDNHYSHWVKLVSDQLVDADGASEVWRLSLATLGRLAGAR